MILPIPQQICASTCFVNDTHPNLAVVQKQRAAHRQRAKNLWVQQMHACFIAGPGIKVEAEKLSRSEFTAGFELAATLLGAVFFFHCPDLLLKSKLFFVSSVRKVQSEEINPREKETRDQWKQNRESRSASQWIKSLALRNRTSSLYRLEG